MLQGSMVFGKEHELGNSPRASIVFGFIIFLGNRIVFIYRCSISKPLCGSSSRPIEIQESRSINHRYKKVGAPHRANC